VVVQEWLDGGVRVARWLFEGGLVVVQQWLGGSRGGGSVVVRRWVNGGPVLA
jgi:hypothetical protein